LRGRAARNFNQQIPDGVGRGCDSLTAQLSQRFGTEIGYTEPTAPTSLVNGASSTTNGVEGVIGAQDGPSIRLTSVHKQVTGLTAYLPCTAYRVPRGSKIIFRPYLLPGSPAEDDISI
jgi:hypothetical protein